MKKAINTRPVTIYLSEADFNKVKEITDEKEISMAEWFRAATKLKLEQDKQEDNNDRQ
jgi:hypothetical protein